METTPTPAARRLGPLVLEPILVERIWGVDHLPAHYPQPQPGKPIGEVWLTAEENKVHSGPFEGRTLQEVAKENVAQLKAEHGFPLLLKILAPKEKLSVQVHPDNAEAQAMGQPRGKTECWYVLEAEPDAKVAVGLAPGVTAEDFKTSIADGTAEATLGMIPVKAGDMVFVDAGTVHAIGPGMLVLETQQYSDVTYRLYDYGRPRELHVQQGLAVTKTATEAGLVTPVSMGSFSRLVACEYFAVDRIEVGGTATHPVGYQDNLQVLVALGDGASLRAADGEVELSLPAGRAVVLPAEGVEYVLRAHGATAVMRILEP